MEDLSTKQTVAVLRDTSTGDCFLVSTGGQDDLDEPRLAEGGLELAGWLLYPEQASGWLPDTDECEDEEEKLPYFTWCDWGLCKRMIPTVDGMAPAYCTKHEEAGA